MPTSNETGCRRSLRCNRCWAEPTESSTGLARKSSSSGKNSRETGCAPAWPASRTVPCGCHAIGAAAEADRGSLDRSRFGAIWGPDRTDGAEGVAADGAGAAVLTGPAVTVLAGHAHLCSAIAISGALKVA